jgi:uncharacterized protein YijF (DUF1287 family)
MQKLFYSLPIGLFLLVQGGLQASPQLVREKIVAASLNGTKTDVTYDSSYFSIKYPRGDVPADRGVCTDVVIRAYRELGIDLQKLVHEDMVQHFDIYPSKKLWGLKKTDTNIDHRRVPNLQTFFERHGKKLTVSNKAEDYQPGDIVTWNVAGFRLFFGKKSVPHIGIVVDKKSKDGKRNMVVHNIGWGHKCDDMLFDYPITGHYSYLPEIQKPS